MLQKLREDEPQADQPLAELDNLRHTDWVRRGSLTWDPADLCLEGPEPWPRLTAILTFSGPRPDSGSSSCGSYATE